MTGTSLINLGELSKPATVLIEKISDAVGGVFKPYQIVRIAKAEAEVERIRTEAQIQVSDLQRRAMHRFLEEEAKRQSNIEGITQKALPLLNDESNPQEIDDDWITNFFDRCRITSDEDMQRLWSRILAGEANQPGAFSKKTVNLLSDLDKGDADLFAHLCGFAWQIGGVMPLMFNAKDKIYNDKGINFRSLGHLESLGLIQFSNVTGFVNLGMPQSFTVFYYGRAVQLKLPAASDNVLDVGKVLLTRAGTELARVCGSAPVDRFFEYIYDKWAAKGYVPRETLDESDSAGG